MHPSRRWSGRIVAFVALFSLAPHALHAKTFVIPHVLETSGKITNSQNTFDTTMFMTYTPGLQGTPTGTGTATVDLYLFDQQTGQPMRGAGGGASVCNPCSYQIGDGGPVNGPRKRTVVLDDEIVNAGGFDAGVKLGFAVIVVSGDQDNVSVTSNVAFASTGPADLGPVYEVAPQEPGGPGCADFAGVRTFVIPHILEHSGKISNTQYTFDTSMFMTYSAGLAGAPAGGGASADLYLLDEATGLPLQSATFADVCNPCTFALGTDGAAGAAPRKRSIVMDDLITAAGGFPAGGVVLGYGIVVVSGDAGSVNLTSFVTNAKSSSLDLAVFGFEPQPLQAATNVALEPAVPGAIGRLSGRPVPATGLVELEFALERAAHVELDIFDAQGRRVAGAFRGRLESGPHVVRWDRRGEAGETLPAGVYFGRLRADDGSRLSRLVFIQ